MTELEAIESLETRIAFQDQSIKELSDELFRQQKQIEKLEEACRRMALQLISIGQDGDDVADADEPPPHY